MLQTFMFPQVFDEYIPFILLSCVDDFSSYNPKATVRVFLPTERAIYHEKFKYC